jgi:hypothetical protein
MAYPNGEIPLNALTLLPGYRDQYLYAEPARQFAGLAQAFYAERKNSLVPVEAYRPRRPTPGLPGSAEGYFFSRYSRVSYRTGLWYDGSWWKRNPGALAAGIPGTSHHGFARAVDVDIYAFSSADYNALARLAPQYGFSLAQGVADGEPWHIVYVGSPRIVASGLGSTAIDNQEDDLQADERAALMEIRDNMPGRPNVHEDGDLWKKILRLEALIVAADANVRGDVAHAVDGALMPRLAQIVEWLNGRIDGANNDRSAESDELLAALRAVAPGDTTVLADLTPVLAAVESLKASLPEATRKALAAALAS